jgi:hypothetical protein
MKIVKLGDIYLYGNQRLKVYEINGDVITTMDISLSPNKQLVSCRNWLEEELLSLCTKESP